MLKFYTYLPELTKNFPIRRASVKDWDWYHRMLDSFRMAKERTGKDPGAHTARCPGIIDICNQGWIHQSYQTIAIETNGDGGSFGWHTEIDQSAQGTLGKVLGNYISQHPPSDLMMYAQFRQNTLASIIKIMSPWYVAIPDGYCLISLPIPYTENLIFSAAPGILRGMQPLNVQLFWHELNGSHIIPAGTPLCQYILLPDIDQDYEIIEGDKDIYNEVNRELILRLQAKFPSHKDTLPNFA